MSTRPPLFSCLSQDSQLDYQGNTWVIFALKDKLRSISNKSTILTISINSSNSSNSTNATNATNSTSSTISNNFNLCSKFIQFKQFHAAIASVLFYRHVFFLTSCFQNQIILPKNFVPKIGWTQHLF